MSVTLYDYQLKFIDDILQAMRTHKHVQAVGVCGMGKSYTFAEIARRAIAKGKKVLILSHRLILLRQNNGALADFGNDIITINDEGHDMDMNQLLYCSTLQTIQSRLKRNGFAEFIASFQLIIIDESHTQFGNFLFETGLIDDTYVIGFSGSPRRSGLMRFLGMDYDVIVPSLSVQDLIDRGKLVPCRYFEVPMDVSDIKVDSMTGDFQAKSNYQKFDSPKIYGGAIENYLKHGENRPFIIFACNIPHVIKTTKEFIKAGIKVKFVVSNLNKPNKPASEGKDFEVYLDRLEAYELLQANKHLRLPQIEVKRAFESGEIQGIVCIEILSTGFDYKPLSCIILNRATQSIPLLIQMGGRVQRPYEGKKDSIVIDLGSNIQRLGTFEQSREWSLYHEMNSAVGIPPEKLCEGVDIKGRKGCGKLILASLAICCHCGFRFATPRELQVVELQERLKEEPNKWSEMSAKTLSDFADLNGYNKHWVFRQLSLRGKTDFENGMKEIGYKWGFIKRLEKTYKITV
jgi:superfamily II DNA or RNA helicase